MKYVYQQKIEISWTREEEAKIEEFRRFLQDAGEKVKDLLPSFYKELNKIDTDLYDILYRCFDEEVDLDD